MYKPLTDAAFGRPLIIKKMTDSELAMRLRRMGLFEESEIIRLDQEVLVQPVRVRGPSGEVVLGGGMGMKIVVHLDDERKLPLVEMQPGETGHIEGLTGGSELASALETLGLKPDDRVRFMRRLPPMEYITVIAGGGRVRLTEGMAAKLWGRMQDQELQFVSARVGEPFEVTRILGGQGARSMLEKRKIGPGRILTLEGVAQAQSLRSGVRNPLVINSREGLRLFLRQNEGEQILVLENGPED
ncbi:MAG: FeoA family protein [Desulfobacteraceae bacterium]|jgi:Fe2+ transport system protein FeoA